MNNIQLLKIFLEYACEWKNAQGDVNYISDDNNIKDHMKKQLATKKTLQLKKNYIVLLKTQNN
jgi:hypothetical protein